MDVTANSDSLRTEPPDTQASGPETTPPGNVSFLATDQNVVHGRSTVAPTVSDDLQHADSPPRGSCPEEHVSETKEPGTRTSSRNSRDMPPLSEDLEWQHVTRSKPEPRHNIKLKALYLGNIRPDTSGQRIASYVRQRFKEVSDGEEIIIGDCTMLEKPPGSEFAGAHLTVQSKSEHLLRQRKFWPRPVYARRWKFKSTPQNGTEACEDNKQATSHRKMPEGALSDNQRAQQLLQDCQLEGSRAGRSAGLEASDSCSSVHHAQTPAQASNYIAADALPLENRFKQLEDMPAPDCTNNQVSPESNNSSPGLLTLALSPESNWGDQSSTTEHNEEYNEEEDTTCNSNRNTEDELRQAAEGSDANSCADNQPHTLIGHAGECRNESNCTALKPRVVLTRSKGIASGAKKSA